MEQLLKELKGIHVKLKPIYTSYCKRGFVSRESVVPSRWGTKKRKFGIESVYKRQTYRKISKLEFRVLALR